MLPATTTWAISSRSRAAREAIECFRAAIRSNPDMMQAHNNLGNALKAEGRVTKPSINIASALRRSTPNYVEGYYNLAHALSHDGTSPTRRSPPIARHCGFVRISSKPASISATCSRRRAAGRGARGLRDRHHPAARFCRGHFRLAACCDRWASCRRPAALESACGSSRRWPRPHLALGNLLQRTGAARAGDRQLSRGLATQPPLRRGVQQPGHDLARRRRLTEAEAVLPQGD